ncbi:MAG: CrcB family protein [Candidatus Paracaedibacteraceae bacterium]|nr:CrcB family protein [Candidatus Paracaedibacteraceae bacterium]
MLIHYIWIGLGGALGAIARAALGMALPPQFSGIPLQIIVVNVIGCGIMGVLAEGMALYWSPPDYIRYFLLTGILGGFTTFSSFALETGLLVDRHEVVLAIVYVMLSVGLSLGAFFLGMKVVRLI